ncbi:hypothetical protein GALL_519680 [mine drainage metagenome]|uniref:Uncharacterized protein n=1 Tax=mine drainage metagenome TaxID=410659 RepID=A0A1J5PSB7_9ZZZZ
MQTRQDCSELHADLQRVEILDHHDELIASKPDHDVGRSQSGLQPLGQLLQQLVACFMTPGVIDALEVIQIDHANREHAANATRARDCFGQALL